MSRILITGAARGIGAETARRLSRRGHQVALLGLEGDLLAQVAAETGGSAHEADVTDRDALNAAVEDAVAWLGGLDAVIANAGIASGGFVRSMDPDAWEKVIEVNVIGMFRTVRAALPHLEASRGYALPVASVAAVAHAPMLSAYCASKAAVEAFANSLRAEVDHRGVDVGCAYLTWIDTEMVRGIDRVSAFDKMRSTLKPPFKKTYPVGVAADALVRGVEKRARIVAAPRWLRFSLPLRALVQPLAERDASTHIEEVERLWEQELAEKGAEHMSAPVGAGGAALK